MNSVLIKARRRFTVGLFYSMGLICSVCYPFDASANLRDSLSELTTQSDPPRKRILLGTVVDASNGETLILSLIHI